MTVSTGKLNGGRVSFTMTKLSDLTKFTMPRWRLRSDHSWLETQKET